MRRQTLTALVLALVTITPAVGAAPLVDIVYRTFDDVLQGAPVGNVEIVRDVVRTMPGALLMSALPSVPASIETPIDLQCANGAVVELRFLVPAGVELSGRVGLADLDAGASRIASVGMVDEGHVAVGLPGDPGHVPLALPAAPGVWHDLRVAIQSGSMQVQVDGGTPQTYTLPSSALPTKLVQSVGGVADAVPLYLDDVRVTPILQRFYDDFAVNTWTTVGYQDPGEFAQLSTLQSHSPPRSMRVKTVDGDSSYGIGVWHAFDVPECLMGRLVSVGVSTWFHLPDPQPWGNAGFSLLQLTSGTDYADTDLHFRVGDFDGDRLLEVAYDNNSAPYVYQPIVTPWRIHQTTTPLPFGGWHHIRADVRPSGGVVNVGDFPGLFTSVGGAVGLPQAQLVVEITLDGAPVGSFPVETNRAPRAAYLGTTWTRPYLSDNFEVYWDDFQVHATLAAPLCSDGVKWFDVASGALSFENVWLDGDDAVESLAIETPAGRTDVTSTRSAPLALPTDGPLAVVYELATTSGLTLREDCGVLRDTTPPSFDLGIPPNFAPGWIPDVELVPTFLDAGTGLASQEILLDGVPVAPTGFRVPTTGEHAITIRAADRIGHAIDETILVRVDTLPPVTTLVLDPPASGGWISHGVAVDLAASDPQSGIASSHVTLNGQPRTPPFTIVEDGTHELRYWSVDNVGNVEPVQTQTVRIDANAPTMQWNGPRPSGWYRGGAPITVIGTDAGSGVATLARRIDGGPLVTVAASMMSFSLTGTGQRSVWLEAVDKVGNARNTTALMRVDSTPPTLTVAAPATGTSIFTPFIDLSTGAGSNVAFVVADTIELSGTAGDAHSGLVAIEALLDDEPVWSTPPADTWQASIRIPAGDHKLRIVARDDVGLTTTRELRVIGIDA